MQKLSERNVYLHPWYVRYTYTILRKVVGFFIKKIWVKRVVGINNIPQIGPAVVALNHQSYFDFLCFTSISPRNIHFLSAEKFFEHWLWKHVMKYTGQIRVNRIEHEKEMTHLTIHAHLDSGKLIGIFPEGTRSPHEHIMLKGFKGVAKYSLHKKVPVIPVGIKGTYHVMSRYDHKPKIKKIVEIHIGTPIFFSEYHNRVLEEKDYEEVTYKIMKEISILSGKHYPY